MGSENFYLLAAKLLSKEASVSEEAELQRLMGENPDLQAAFHNLEELWQSSSQLKHNQSVTEEAYLIHLAHLKDSVNDFEDIKEEFTCDQSEDFQLYPVPRKWYQRWQPYAAAILILGACFFSFQYFNKGNAQLLADNQLHINEINVNPGARSKLTLPDGSQVWVNSDSKLSYDESFKGPLREVFLEGEAYFDVVKDPAHPFIVHTSGIDIKVLGTAFNVKAYSAEPTIEATLVHGMIEVTKTNQPDASKVILKRHEKLIFDKYAVEQNDKVVSSNKTPAASILNKVTKPAITIAQLPKALPDSAFIETAWVYNRLSFEDEKFEDLAIRMERWFNVEINIRHEKLQSYKLTGSFENETIEEALKELQYLVPFKYKMNGKEITIMR